MNTVLYDLQAAETHWHDLQAEAEHERIVQAALKLHGKETARARLSRYLDALRGRNPDGTPVEPHKN